MIRSCAVFLLFSLSFASSSFASCSQISFEPRVFQQIGGGLPLLPRSTVDVNGDGRSDVTIVLPEEYSFQTFLGTTNLMLTPGTRYQTQYTLELLIANLDGDGKPDAVAESGYGLRFYAGNGDATYTLKGEIDVGGALLSVASGDLNADGRTDIAMIVLTVSGPELAVLTQSATPWTFVPVQRIPFGAAEPHQARISDLDGDGNLDVAAIGLDNAVYIAYGKGDGTFTASVKITLPDVYLSNVGGFVLGDFNYDGRPDFAAGQIGNGAAIFVNDGGRQFHFDRQVASSAEIQPGGGARDVALSDMNADGLPDLIISTYGGFLTLQALPAGFFAPPVFHPLLELDVFGGLDTARFLPGDFRGDGRSDLFISTHVISQNFTSIYPNACIPPPTLTSITPATGIPSGGTTVKLTGTSLLTTTQVLFGTTAATILDITGTSVTVRTPASAASLVDVRVTTSGGSATLTGGYRYAAAPVTLTVRPQFTVNLINSSLAMVATLSSPVTGGTITFREGSTTHGTVPVTGGGATITLPATAARDRTIEATFSGTTDYAAATGSTTVHMLTPVTLTLQTSSVLVAGAQYRLVATTNPAANGGTVVFTRNGLPAGSATVVNGVASIELTASSQGPFLFAATFSGFGDYAPASAQGSAVITQAIPTLSEFTLAALAMLLGAIAVLRLR